MPNQPAELLLDEPDDLPLGFRDGQLVGGLDDEMMMTT